MVKVWNALSESVVEASSITAFKRKLNCYPKKRMCRVTGKIGIKRIAERAGKDMMD